MFFVSVKYLFPNYLILPRYDIFCKAAYARLKENPEGPSPRDCERYKISRFCIPVLKLNGIERLHDGPNRAQLFTKGSYCHDRAQCSGSCNCSCEQIWWCLCRIQDDAGCPNPGSGRFEKSECYWFEKATVFCSFKGKTILLGCWLMWSGALTLWAEAWGWASSCGCFCQFLGDCSGWCRIYEEHAASGLVLISSLYSFSLSFSLYSLYLIFISVLCCLSFPLHSLFLIFISILCRLSFSLFLFIYTSIQLSLSSHFFFSSLPFSLLPSPPFDFSLPPVSCLDLNIFWGWCRLVDQAMCLERSQWLCLTQEQSLLLPGTGQWR